MKIKQVEERLDVPRTHIRYLQREGMFTPRAYANKYRDFTEDDIQDLEMTLILMKAGVSAKDVISLQEEETTLEDVLSRTETIMREKVEEMLGGLELIQEIRASNHTFDSLPRDAYWQEIKRKEKTGQRFMGHYELEDISDYTELAIPMERIVECPHCGGKNRVDLEDFIYDASSYERQMGAEVQHSFDSTDTLECSSCGKAFRISGIICEYPAGTLETEEIKIDKEWED